jgi:hypothetical protein
MVSTAVVETSRKRNRVSLHSEQFHRVPVSPCGTRMAMVDLRSRPGRGKLMDEDEVSEIALVEEFLQHALMKETADYARRGRQYASALVSDINDQWTEAFQAVFTQRQQHRIREMDDLAAELRIRGLEPPYDRVEQEVAALQDALLSLNTETTPEDLCWYDFMIERAKPKH